MRDWVTNVASTHYVIGSVMGPHPFPMMVRDFQRVIGDEARAQLLELTGRLPDAVTACVGGGSNAMGIFTAFVPDAGRALIGYEAGGEGRRGRAARGDDRGRARRACCTACGPTCCRTRTGRRCRPRRSRPGWTIPGSAPSTPGCYDTGRATYRSVTDGQAMEALELLAPHRGHPVRDRDRARGRTARSSWPASSGRTQIVLVCLSGRGDKDMDTAARWFDLLDPARCERSELE